MKDENTYFHHFEVSSDTAAGYATLLVSFVYHPHQRGAKMFALLSCGITKDILIFFSSQAS